MTGKLYLVLSILSKINKENRRKLLKSGVKLSILSKINQSPEASINRLRRCNLSILSKINRVRRYDLAIFTHSHFQFYLRSTQESDLNKICGKVTTFNSIQDQRLLKFAVVGGVGTSFNSIQDQLNIHICSQQHLPCLSILSKIN